MRRMIALIALLVPLPVIAQTTASRNVPDAVSCTRCAISVHELVRLGTEDGDGSLSGFPTAVRADNRGRYWVIQWRQPPLVFGPTGSFLRNLGRAGRGPGEFVAPFDVIPLTGDSVLVVDAGASRATVVSPDLQARRSVSLRTQLFSTRVVRWPHQVVTNTRAGGPAMGWPLHVVSFAGSTIDVVRSLGADEVPDRPLMVAMPTHQVAVTSAGRVWAADVRRYRLAEWTVDGQRVATLERNPDWFSGTVSGGLGSPTSPPPPAIQAVHVDDDGLLWVFAAIAAPTWREAWPRTAGRRREVRAQEMAYEKLYRTTIEVIDPSAARVVARRTLDRWVMAALPGRRIAAYVVDRDGIPRVEVSQIGLTRGDERPK